MGTSSNTTTKSRIASTTTTSKHRRSNGSNAVSNGDNLRTSRSDTNSHDSPAQTNTRSEQGSNSKSNEESQSSTAYSECLTHSQSESHSNSRSHSKSKTSNSRSLSNSASQLSSKKSLPSLVCIEGNKTVLDGMVGRIVKNSIFPKKQFLVLERELDENSNVAKSLVRELNIDPSKWYSIKNLVRQRLNRVRNNAQLCVRKKLYRYMEKNGVDSIDLQRVLEGRKNRDTFHWFLDHIASAVVSTRVAEQVKFVKRPSEWLSRSLEAFSLVCLENFFEMTRNQILHKDSTARYQALWTADGRGKLKNQGWDQDGIKRYNVLCRAVQVDRERYSMEDDVYLTAKQEERQRMEAQRLKRRQDRTEKREQGLEAAMDDFTASGDDCNIHDESDDESDEE